MIGNPKNRKDCSMHGWLHRHVLPATILHCAIVGSAVVASYVTCGSPAVGQSDEGSLPDARAKFQRGVEQEHAGDFTGALQLFRAVSQVRMTPQVRYHIAICEEHLGKLVAALGGYGLALADADQVGNEFREEVEQKANSLAARIPKLVIERGAGAQTASIELDGIGLGTTSLGNAITLDPGPHVITATAPDRVRFEVTVTLSERDQKRVAVVMTPPVASTTASTSAPVAAPVSSDPGLPQHRSRSAAYILAGVGGASLVTSGVLYLLRNQAVADLEEVCGPARDQCPASSKSTYDNARTYNVVSQVALGVGIVAIGVAIPLYVNSGRNEKRPTAVGVSPQIGAFGGGLSAFGSF
jgi:hypothetical protein